MKKNKTTIFQKWLETGGDAFVVSVTLMTIICLCKGVFPLGDQCILRTDLYNQYMPFFTEMLHKLKAGESLAYSWKQGLGGNFLGLYAYYLSSPFNWLLLLCPQSYIIEFMTFLIILKTGLSGWSMNYYFRKRMEGRSRSLTLMFSCCYSLSGFWAAYNWNIMWMDVIALTPLVILGLEELWEGRGTKKYFASLSLAILCNFYLSIMLCIFIVLYSGLQIVEKPVRTRKMPQFLVVSVLAGGVGSVLLLPEYYALKVTKFSSIHFPEEPELYFPFWEELTRNLVGVENELMLEHWPNSYAGLLPLLLILPFLFNRKVSIARRIGSVLLVVLFWGSFAFNMADFVWHGFHYPDSLPARQSYLYIFLLVTMGFQGLQGWIEEQRPLVIVGGAINWILLACLIVAGRNWNNTSYYSANEAYLLSGSFLLLYGLLFIIWVISAKYSFSRSILLTVLCGGVIAELGLNGYLTSVKTVSRSTYLENSDAVSYLFEEMSEDSIYDPEDEDRITGSASFFRMENPDRMTKNDGMRDGYRSASIFSSTNHYGVATFYRDMGMLGSKTFYCAKGMTPLMAAMLSVRYQLSERTTDTDYLHKLVAKEEPVSLYENRYWLPLGFCMDQKTIENWDYDSIGVLSAQNRLVKALGITDKLFCSVETERQDGILSLTIPKDGFYYVSNQAKNIGTIEVRFPEEDYKNLEFTKVYQGYILDLGFLNQGDQVVITGRDRDSEDLRDDFNATVTVMYENVLKDVVGILNQDTMELEEITATTLAGSLQLDRSRELILTIPYEEGWEALIDGKKQEIKAFKDAFIQLSVASGKHSIQLVYHVPGFWEGLGVSGLSLILYIVLERFLHYDRKRRQKGETDGIEL